MCGKSTSALAISIWFDYLLIIIRMLFIANSFPLITLPVLVTRITPARTLCPFVPAGNQLL